MDVRTLWQGADREVNTLASKFGVPGIMLLIDGFCRWVPLSECGPIKVRSFIPLRDGGWADEGQAFAFRYKNKNVTGTVRFVDGKWVVDIGTALVTMEEIAALGGLGAAI